MRRSVAMPLSSDCIAAIMENCSSWLLFGRLQLRLTHLGAARHLKGLTDESIGK